MALAEEMVQPTVDVDTLHPEVVQSLEMIAERPYGLSSTNITVGWKGIISLLNDMIKVMRIQEAIAFVSNNFGLKTEFTIFLCDVYKLTTEQRQDLIAMKEA